MSEVKNGQTFNAAFVIAVALVLSSVVGAWAYTRSRSTEQTITVTGSARRRIKSDLVVWRATVTQTSTDVSGAYSALRDRVPRVRAYLLQKGVPENEIVTSSVTSRTLSARDENGMDTGQITGYVLSQTLEVRSADVDRVTRISREVTELIDQGILVESGSPEYHYTRLGELKVDMLAEAARDAKARAEQIASSTGSSIGSVRSARMGVMQITAADSNEVSDSGMNDTSSLDKDITAVVNASFAIE